MSFHCALFSSFSVWHIAVMALGTFVCYSTCKSHRGIFTYLDIFWFLPSSFHFKLSHLATLSIRARDGASRIWECLEGWMTPCSGSASSAVLAVAEGLLNGNNRIIPRERNTCCRNRSHWRKRCLWLVLVIYFGSQCKFIHSYRGRTSTKERLSWLSCKLYHGPIWQGSAPPASLLLSAGSKRIHMACSW